MIDIALVYDPTHVYEFAISCIIIAIALFMWRWLVLCSKPSKTPVQKQPIPSHPTNWHYTPEPYDGGKRVVYGFYQCNIRKFYVEYEWQAIEILKILNGKKE
jgi:hypothetical protein